MTGLARTRPAILLVHGAWHGSWCWKKLEGELAAAGQRTLSVDLPSVAEKGAARFGLHDDANAVRACLDGVDEPVVVVAHSYGGAPVTEGAAGADNVDHIVYLTAFLLDAGDSLLGSVGGQAPPWWQIDGDTITPDAPREVFYNDVDPLEADLATAQLLPQSLAAFTEELAAAAWKTVPSTYVVCEQDQAIPVFAQEAMATRAGKIVRLSTGHSPFLSRPGELATLLTTISDREH